MSILRFLSAFWRGGAGPNRAPAGETAQDAAMLAFLRQPWDPADFPGLEQAMQQRFDLLVHGSLYQRTPELARLAANRDLAAAFLFHRDGYMREAALKALDDQIEIPAAAYGLILRLNDWAPQVRAAAEEAFERCLARSDPEGPSSRSLAGACAWAELASMGGKPLRLRCPRDAASRLGEADSGTAFV